MTLKDILISGKLTISEGGGGGSVAVSKWMDAPEPTDSKLHVWVCIDDDSLKFVELQVNGTGNIDWGDGETESNVNLRTSHTYAAIGVYEIVVDGSITLPNNNQIITAGGYPGLYTQRRIIRRAYIPSSIGNIGNSKFVNCYLLEKATINNTGAIGGSVFENDNGLKEIVIGDNVTSIDGAAFRYCNAAKKVVVGASVSSIGSNAFNSVKAYEWHFKPTTPPTLTNMNTFGSTESSAIFYVPAESVEAYKTANIWSEYASRIQAEP